MSIRSRNVSGLVAEHSGHWLPEEQPVWLSQQLIAFFKSKN
jgi:hypothetical protein